jgi:tetratricopeptide (TPR) repeat protein
LQNNLARLYSTLGDYNKAESLYLRALGIREKVLGSDHPDVAESLNNLASLSRALNNVDNAIAYQRRGNEVRERILNQNLILGSERQKLLYLSMSGKETDRTLSLHIQTAPHNLLASQMALTILLRRKGRVLDAINDSLGQVRRNLKPQDQALLNELIGSRVRLATDTINGPGKLRVEEHRSNLRQLDERVDQLEGELSARSAEFRTQSQLITLEAVQKAIPAGAVLVEFASYHPYDARSGKYASSRYVAYTLAARGEPHWVELGAAGPIEKVVGSLRAALRDPKRRDVKQLSRALDAKVMQPVRKLIGQNKWLLISADGALNLIPFAALVDENSQYLVKKYLFT